MEEQTRRRKIGEIRFDVREVKKGCYTPANCPANCKNDDELIEVTKKPTLLVRVEVLSYEYTLSRQNPGWHLQGWREPTPEEVATWHAEHKTWWAKRKHEADAQALTERFGRKSWWRRFWHPFERRHALAPAKVVEDD